MSSLRINPAGTMALQSLRANRIAIGKTQEEISTGLKISRAADNPSSWAIAETMKSDKAVLSTVVGSLALASSVLTVADAAVKATIAVMNEIKARIVQAGQPGADAPKLLTDLQQFGKQLTSIVASARFNDVNLLDTSNVDPFNYNIIASYNNGAGIQNSTTGIIFLNLKTLVDQLGGHFGVLEAAQAPTSASPTDFTALEASDLATSAMGHTLNNAEKAIADLKTYASMIGTTRTHVARQTEFIKILNEALTSGISVLVDADMTETSTRIQALQAQQQLGTQALSIANRNANIVLKLFT
jgi:flagellin